MWLFYSVFRTVLIFLIVTGVLNLMLFFRYHDYVGLIAVTVRMLISVLLLVSVKQKPADQEEDGTKSISIPQTIMLVLVFLLSQAVISEHLATVAVLSKPTIQAQRP